MMESQVSRKTGIRFLEYALIAFAGLGLEVLLWIVLEPMLYGCPSNEWSTFQNISHWILTCICWGAVFFFLVKQAKKECGYDLFAPQEKVKSWPSSCSIISSSRRCPGQSGRKTCGH